MSTKDADVTSAIKTIDRQVTSGSRFRRIANALKLATSATLTKVAIVSTETYLHPVTGNTVTFKKVQVIDTRKALKDTIIAHNKKHFAQAEGTPFMQEPFVRISSDNGYNVYRDAQHNDIHVPEDSFVETKTVMEILWERLMTEPIRWSDEVSFDDFISSFLHWNEQTVTSPSGRHLCLYGALVTAYCNSSGELADLTPDIETSTQEMAEHILVVIHGLAVTAARHGFYLHRWIQVVNVMIYKKPGCVELDKLRVIHLFEADSLKAMRQRVFTGRS
jgi:hypothetical protein